MKRTIAATMLAAATLVPARAAAPDKDTADLEKARACRAALAREHGSCMALAEKNEPCDAAVSEVATTCYTMDKDTACSAAALEVKNLCITEPSTGRCVQANRALDLYCHGKRS
ncbi:MAG TPA: hypothetical protein VMK05_17305 [Burkholderiales bacterium]|nr:hypothetical protein [Burkholderiales bacterium]